MYEAFLAFCGYGKKICFVFAGGSTKQIYKRGFPVFCLIFPHDPHVFRIVNNVYRIATVAITKNMRFMRMYEGWIFNGFYLPCIEIGNGSRPKHEANMRERDGHPHVFYLQARRIG